MLEGVRYLETFMSILVCEHALCFQWQLQSIFRSIISITELDINHLNILGCISILQPTRLFEHRNLLSERFSTPHDAPPT